MLRKFYCPVLPVFLLWTLALLTLPCASQVLAQEATQINPSQSTGNSPAVCQHCGAYHQQGTPLFSNYYVSGGNYGVPADMYPAPRPTPPIIGHVYYTYQPFMPHEMLYTHHRNYSTYDSYSQLQNRTSVKWSSGHYRRTNFKTFHR